MIPLPVPSADLFPLSLSLRQARDVYIHPGKGNTSPVATNGLPGDLDFRMNSKA
jgi:hypothetical protein